MAGVGTGVEMAGAETQCIESRCIALRQGSQADKDSSPRNRSVTGTHPYSCLMAKHLRKINQENIKT